MLRVNKSLFTALLMSASMLSPSPASAETIFGALSKAYQNNSQLNSTRAGVRVTDEGVAIAKSGYRPTIAGSANIDYSSTKGPLTAAGVLQRGSTRLTTASFGVEINQTLFDGFQTRNTVAGAEAQVRASNENLRNTEQNILYSAASAYMDVIRDRQIAVLTEQNLKAITEQVRAARSRLEVGEGTRTDVAQTEAARSQALAQLSAARALAAASAATYRQIVGEEPGKLSGASPMARQLPKSLDSAIAMAANEHPAILANEHLVDAAAFAVKSAEGALLPQITASAGLSRSYKGTVANGAENGLPGVGDPIESINSHSDSNSADIGATLTIPFYTGGRVDAQVRQNKEMLGQARIEVDVARDQVRQAVSAAWAQYMSAQENVDADRATISAAQLALNGVIEERNVGQRTTQDVLNAQSDVITAQINLAGAEHDLVVGSYGILLGVGHLTVERLGLQVAKYQPEEHYKAVKDKWIGLRTPDGR